MIIEPPLWKQVWETFRTLSVGKRATRPLMKGTGLASGIFCALVPISLVRVSQCRAAPAESWNSKIPDPLGVNIHFGDPKPGEMEMIAGAGFHWARMDCLWKVTEKTKGIYNFSYLDPLIPALESHHMRLIMILCYANPLYDGGLAPHTDEGRRAFANWAVAAVKHFAGHHILWEMFNEANGYTFWKPRPSADDYTKLFLTVGKAIRSAAPDEEMVGPALSKMDDPFLEACFKAGLLEYWSAVTIHPYRNSDPETVEPDYHRIKLMIARYAPAGKSIPLISGEWGYSSADAGMDDDRQARYLARQWLTNMANEIPVSIWYDWHDDGKNPKDSESNYGTVHWKYQAGADPIYTPKAAYAAAKSLIAELSGFEFNKRLEIGSDEDHILLFSKGDDLRIAAWTTASAHDAAIPVNAGTFDVLSFKGESLPSLSADAAGLKTHLTNDPQYLTPHSPNDLLNIAANWQRPPLENFADAPSTLPVKTMLRNPTAKSIHVKSSAGEMIDIAAGQTATLTFPVPLLCTIMRDPITLGLDVDGAGHLAQRVWIDVSNPLSITPLPIGDKTLMVRIDNPAGQAFAGTITLRAHGSSADASGSSSLSFAAGETEKRVRVETDQPVPPDPTLVATVKSADGSIVASQEMPTSTVLSTGLEKNAFSPWPPQPFSPSAAAEPPPTLRGPVERFDYHLEAQRPKPTITPTTKPVPPVTTVTISPRGGEQPIVGMKGRPRNLVMWIDGDGSGNEFLVRFTDSTGQTFQTNAQRLDWTGWKAVEFPLDDPSVWHYGGAKDDIIHYPIQLNALFLIESPRRETSSGTLYFADPTIVWDSPEQQSRLN